MLKDIWIFIDTKIIKDRIENIDKKVKRVINAKK